MSFCVDSFSCVFVPQCELFPFEGALVVSMKNARISAVISILGVVALAVEF